MPMHQYLRRSFIPSVASKYADVIPIGRSPKPRPKTESDTILSFWFQIEAYYARG